MPAWLKNSFLGAAEALYTLLPRPTPDATSLAAGRIVSHRGERDGRVVFENTFAAFDSLINAGVWAIECDIRWTRDLQPVIVHDLDLLRVFGTRERVCDLSLTELRATAPQIPSLVELLERYGRQIHLMLEIKAEDYPSPDKQHRRLQQLLAGFEPAVDFHFLALNTTLFEHVAGFDPACWLPVARTNIKQMSQFALANGCAGFAGPYSLISSARIQRHRDAGQQVGVGFPAHRNVLFRELNRGANWIFSNHALQVQNELNKALG